MLFIYGVIYGFGAAAAAANINYIAQIDPSKAYRASGDCGHIGDFHYCSGTVDELDNLAADDGIIAIEPDHIVSVSGCQHDAPWHLHNLGDTYSYEPTKSGQNVTVYVVDTWVDVKHPEFGNRAKHGFSNVGGEHYHGTHVAGIIASKTYGVAKKATIISVQVLNGDGTGSYSGIMEGLAWIGPRKKGIVNISIGGPYSLVVNRAVEALQHLGHVVVVAAGNSRVDACGTTPGSANVIAVGALDKNNVFAPFSNWGECVDIVAPGVMVQSTIPGGKNGFLSGTSMASPFVAGVAAVEATGKHWPTPDEIRNWIFINGLHNAITQLPQQTPNIVCKQTRKDAFCSDIKGEKPFLILQQ